MLVGPLGVVFVAWYAAYGRNGQSLPRPTATQARVFIWAAISSVFGQLAQVRWVGWVLFAVLVAGTVVAVRTIPWTQLRSRFASVTGLFVGGLVFVVTTTVNRGFAVSTTSDVAARVPRYLYVIAAFFLPAIAAAASVLARRRIVVAAMVVLLLVGLPGNADLLYPSGVARVALGRPAILVALATSPLLAQAPAGMQPNEFLLPDMTAGWLRNAVAGGEIPTDVAVSQKDREGARLSLSLEQMARPARTTTVTPCRPARPSRSTSATRSCSRRACRRWRSWTATDRRPRSSPTSPATGCSGCSTARCELQVAPPTPRARISLCT